MRSGRQTLPPSPGPFSFSHSFSPSLSPSSRPRPLVVIVAEPAGLIHARLFKVLRSFSRSPYIRTAYTYRRYPPSRKPRGVLYPFSLSRSLATLEPFLLSLSPSTDAREEHKKCARDHEVRARPSRCVRGEIRRRRDGARVCHLKRIFYVSVCACVWRSRKKIIRVRK